MNRIRTIIFVTLIALTIFSCKKSLNRPPVVTTSSVTPSYISAQCSGVLYLSGDDEVTEKGICWGAKSDISINDNKISCGNGTGNFSAEITGLQVNKNYYVRAYAINQNGVSYGKAVSFRTLPLTLPNITIGQAYSVTVNSALFNVSISNTYSNTTYTTGICWSNTTEPTVQNSFKTYTPGSLNYIGSLSELGGGVNYYVRAFNSNSLGTIYSNQVTFTTNAAIKLNSLTVVDLNNATCNVEVLDPNTDKITSLGVCWSTNQMPTISDSKTSQNFNSTVFSDNMTNLLPNTTYYLRAYLVNNVGVLYSEQKVIKTLKGTVTDFDGNVYYTVEIGNQEWMTSNLKVTHFNDGTEIQYVSSLSDWGFYSGQFRRIYSYYNDSPGFNSVYGKLYNWYTVADPKQLAPAGWRIPSEADWNILMNFLAGSLGESLNTSPDDGYWIDGNGKNLTGFSAQPGGYRNYGGVCDMMGYGAYFWSTTPTETYYARYFNINGFSGYFDKLYKESGLSVRCIKN